MAAANFQLLTTLIACVFRGAGGVAWVVTSTGSRVSNTDNLMVLVGLTAGQTGVNQRQSATSSTSLTNVTTLSNLDLFSNWMAFLPDYVKPLVHVMYDLGEEQEVRQHVDSIDTRVSLEGRNFSFSEWDMRWRVEALQSFLKQGKDVIISDLDTVWLQDPVPFVTKWSESVVGMREFSNWHSLNCGFVLYRSSFAPMAGRWLQAIDSSGSDEHAFEQLFGSTTSSWSEQEGGMSVGTNSDFAIRLLPVHEFPREFTILPDCSQCPATITDQSVVGTCCVDDQVIVLHHKGEIFRDRQQHPAHFPILWKA